MLLWLGGCATVDFDYPKEPSTYVADTSDTYLAGLVDDLVAAHPGQSAFYMQSDGVEALATRVLLALRAERTIDVQYYLIKNDPIGYVFIESLLNAADRGVRVRVLLDDVFTKDYDAGLAVLDDHPDIEIRIFNPVARGGSRFWNGLTDFSRVNRRMHNKTFTVDNRFTIVGGRNIASEYFAANDETNFGDLDVLAYGPIVDDVSRMFDSYWNDELAVSIDALIEPPEDPEMVMAQLRATIIESREALSDTRYAEVLTAAVFEMVSVQPEEFDWAPYELAFDAPEKGAGVELDAEDSILTPMRDAVATAEESLLILSPYFVPRKAGLEFFRKLRERGIEVRVVTNSLASNNHAIVHSGYAPVRKKLLDMGVKLYEVRPDALPTGVERAGGAGTEANLHLKVFIVDRRLFFLGSFNFDPRSAYINTELGVIIDSPKLAGWGVDEIDAVLAKRTYELRLNDQYQLRWYTREDGEWVKYEKEPETTAWLRFKVGLMRMLPIKGQL